MLRPRIVCELRVDPATHPRGQPHLSSASGLVQAGRFLYLVADDEHHLGQIELPAAATVRLVRLRPHDLPHDKEDRKRRKPDLEALAWLPPHAAWPHGALLAIGSGSRPQREGGFLLALDANGALHGALRELDLHALHAPLRERFGDLNIEGAFAGGNAFRLLQRANGAFPINACISYPLADLVDWVVRGGPPPSASIEPFALATVQGVPYGFTDGTALPGGAWMFSAVAEDTQDSYADGRCLGSALGRVGPQGALEFLLPLAGAPKVEGVTLVEDGRLLMVTDADDPATPSILLELDAGIL